MNVFDKLRYEADREVVDRLFHSPALRVERIASQGQGTSFMVQEEDELVFLVRGEAIIEDADRRLLEMEAGELFYLPAGLRHRVKECSDDCLWLCFFFPPQEGARFFNQN
ncbi:MAG: cupin domain-containing protein [Eubacteriales bacterium]|nr:cupin domain-containing protein [Eubacteriales bacterium]